MNWQMYLSFGVGFVFASLSFSIFIFERDRKNWLGSGLWLTLYLLTVASLIKDIWK